MGEDPLSQTIDDGELKCGHCQQIIGAWTWTPTDKQTLSGRLQPPVIRVHKNAVHEVLFFVLSMYASVVIGVMNRLIFP